MGIANANYEFIMVHFGNNGRVFDGGVTEYTEFYHKLKHNELHIPKPSYHSLVQQQFYHMYFLGMKHLYYGKIFWNLLAKENSTLNEQYLTIGCLEYVV